MRIEIEIPKEFENHFKRDKFKDSFERIMADIKHSLENGDCLCAGRYEYETVEMLEKAFENSKSSYDIDKVVEELEGAMWLTTNDDGETNNLSIQVVSFEDAIEIVKQGCVSDDVCEPSADKIKVTSLEVIVTGSKIKPYYEIKYKEVGTDNYNIGYSSYNLDFVLDWKEKCFELVKAVE